jgi:hypothetical protein
VGELISSSFDKYLANFDVPPVMWWWSSFLRACLKKGKVQPIQMGNRTRFHVPLGIFGALSYDRETAKTKC